MSQLASRMAGENRTRLTMVQLLCAVSIWRTAMTQVAPLCGASAWWVTIICLLPGLAVAVLLRLVMHLTRTNTLTEAVRACLGVGGTWVLSIILAALLLIEGLAGLTALITLFTHGIGTRGTALTMALLTGGALLFSLHREGLPRAVYVLRWPIVSAAVIIVACALPEARLDHLFPLHGEGNVAVFAGIKAGFSLSWPAILLLTVQPSRQGRLRSAVLPAFAVVAALLCMVLLVPQELFAGQRGVTDLLLLPGKYAANALRILYLCLIMLVIFLSIGASVQLTVEYICAPLKRTLSWLSYALLIALVLTQTGDTTSLWDALKVIQPWLLLPLGGISILCLPIAHIRRKNR